MEKIRVVLIDRQMLLLIGLKALFEGDPHIIVQFYSTNVKGLYNRIIVDTPDIIIVSLEMIIKFKNVFYKNILLNFPSIKMIVLSSFQENSLLLLNGLRVNSFLTLEDLDLPKLRTAILNVFLCDYFFMTSDLSERKDKLEKINKYLPDIIRLSFREKQILNFICTSLTNAEISIKLGLSKRTVEAYRKNLIKKMKVKNTAQLVYNAIKKKIVSDD